MDKYIQFANGEADYIQICKNGDGIFFLSVGNLADPSNENSVMFTLEEFCAVIDGFLFAKDE